MILNMLSNLEHAWLISALQLPDIPIWVFWLVLLVIFLIAEAVTVSLVSIWFAVGTLVALIMNVLGASFTSQVLTMLVVSLAFLVFFVKRRKGRGRNVHLPTNADRHLGRMARVIQAVDPIQGTGQILVDGLTWSAKSADGLIIEADRQVIIVEIQGVHALVKEVEA